MKSFLGKIFNKGNNKSNNNNSNINFTSEELYNPENAKKLVLDTLAHIYTDEECVLQEDSVYYPQYDIKIIPYIQNITKNSVTIELIVESNMWDKSLYECTVGMGSDPNTSIGMALSSFIFGFLDGIKKGNAKENTEIVTSYFVNKEYNYKFYKTDIVGMGTNNTEADTNVYWNILKEDIISRLGNQKLYYVKIFGSKFGNDVTGECRINDVESRELGKKVAEYVKTWNIEGFASQKQFFFFYQDENNYIPSPYAGKEGFNVLKEKVFKAVNLFYESDQNNTYETLLTRIQDAIQDKTLGYECYAFLPELCTENAFQEMIFSEQVELFYDDKTRYYIYKTQLSEYHRLWAALNSLFCEDAFGEKTNDIYRTLILYSSAASCIAQMKENGSDIKDARCAAIIYPVDKEFEIR